MSKRIVAMATFPPRLDGMLETVRRLLPQCDVLHIYMNGYTERPAGLPEDPKLDIILAGGDSPFTDLGSHGKFYWVGDEEGYYCSVDDDILYPADYIDKLVEGVERYGRKAIVGFHGGIYRLGQGTAFPVRGITRELRQLFGYSARQGTDVSVHTLGAGVMASYPTAIGLNTTAFASAVGSGDDEDVALFSQRTGTPCVRLASKENWILPNSKVWQIDALHRRKDYMSTSDAKLKSWTRWRVLPLPQKAAAAYRLPSVPAVPEAPTIPAGPCLDKVLLTPEDLAFTNKILSSDALAAQLITRIKQRTPTSVIRMSDGERAIIEFSQGKPASGFMKSPDWLKRYGLLGSDLAKVGRDLLKAGQEADYLACTISGVFWDCFRVHQFFPERTQYIDQFFPQLWVATDRLGPILRAGPVLVLHREHDKYVDILRRTYGQPNIQGMKLDSWRDHAALMDSVKGSTATTVLLSGGASGKPFAVRLAQHTGKVVIDAGEGLGRTWCNPDTVVCRAGGKLP